MAEEIIFKTRVDTGSTADDLEKIDTELKSIATTTSKMGADVGGKFDALNAKIEAGGMSVRELTRSVRDYQSIALEAGRTSVIGQEALQKAGDLKDQLGDLKREITNLGVDGRKLQGALQIGSAVTASYGAIQGAMALTGMQSESLEKTMVKLQAATTILNGLEELRTALEKESLAVLFVKNTATKVATVVQYAWTAAVGSTVTIMGVLKFAMLALPIVALVAGIGFLIAAASGLFDSNETLAESYDKLTKAIDAQNDAVDRSNKKYTRDIDNKIKLAKSLNKSQEEIHGLEQERIKIEEGNRLRDLQQTEWNISQKSVAYKRAIKEKDADKAKEIGDEIRNERAKEKDLKELKGQAKIDKQLLDNDYANSLKDQNEKEKNENVQKHNQKKSADDQAAAQKLKDAEEAARKKLELERAFEDLSIANTTDAEVRRRMELAIAQKREREDMVAKFGDNQKLKDDLIIKQTIETNALEKTLKDEHDKVLTDEEIKKNTLDYENKKAKLEGDLIAMQEDFDAKQSLELQLAELEKNRLLENTELQAGEIYKIEQEFLAKKEALRKEDVENEQRTNDAIRTSRQALATAVAGVFGQIAGLAKEGSKAAKAAALVEIGINTAVGFMQGLRIAQRAALTSPTPILTYGIFAAQQFGAVLAAASQAKKILGSASSVSAPSSSSGGGGTSSGGGGAETPPTGTESNLTSTLTNNAAPQQVFVTDSAITAVQNRSLQVQAVSTIG